MAKKIEGIDYDRQTSADDSLVTPLHMQAEPRQEKLAVEHPQHERMKDEMYQWNNEQLG